MSKYRHGIGKPPRNENIKQASKITRVHVKTEDYHKARTLSSWLFMKYDMSYKTYRNKSKKRRDALREEFAEDTGVNKFKSKEEKECDYYTNFLSEIGVPISSDGTPLGIG